MSPEALKQFAGSERRILLSLNAEQFEQAQALSQNCRVQSKQWSIYRQALALFAFSVWLDYRAPRLQLALEQGSVFQPNYAHLLDAVSFLKVGDIRVCLLPHLIMGGQSEWVLPKAVQDIPALAAHFYVVVGIDEDAGVAAIEGFLRHDQLHTLTATQKPDADWNYTLPMDALQTQTQALLLHFQCLSPGTIPLPTGAVRTPLERTDLTESLMRYSAHPVQSPWTWEEYQAILTDAHLRAWVYDQLSEGVKHREPEIIPAIQQTLVDIRQWWRTQLDGVEELWVWRNIGTANLAFRFDDDLPSVLSQVQAETQVLIPETASRVYSDVDSAASGLRLYAFSWIDESQWHLLLILGTESGYPTNYGATLTIQAASQTLWESQLQPPKPYQYVQLNAQFDEVLTITVTPPESNAHIYSLTCRS